ncbi:MAG: argininosuccinate lyase [Negativicutes bacterium]
MSKLWNGRFSKETDVKVKQFTASIPFDQHMYRGNIAGSIAHARMLARCGIITSSEAEAIIAGLDSIRADIEAGNFSFEVALEDIHMNIEKALTDRIGPVGGKLHTGRSRNDQSVLDSHLFLRQVIAAICGLIAEMEAALVEVAENHSDVIMPGYTHMQRAQPILFAHHMMAYFFMLTRDFKRMQNCWEQADTSPLGAGALAGTTFPIDRHFVAEQLRFSAVYENSIDAVSDRDHIIEFLSATSLLMVHLSRLSEEIVLWSSSEFSFIELDDAHCTGSSIMPQKKNPDVAELVRGKSGRVFGNLMALLVTMKGLPLAYNKDMQEDKEGLMDTVDTVKLSLTVYADMIRAMKVKGDRMAKAVTEDFSNATDMADYLVKKGLPFRQAHEIVGKSVRYCIENDKLLVDLSLKELEKLSPLFEEDICEAIKVSTCITARNSYGGTSPTQVARELALGKEILLLQRQVVETFSQAASV